MKATTRPSRRIGAVMLTSDDSDGTEFRLCQFDTPIKPGPGKRVVCALIPSLFKAPVDKGGTPWSLITASSPLGKGGGVVIIHDARIVYLPPDFGDPKLTFGYV